MIPGVVAGGMRRLGGSDPAFGDVFLLLNGALIDSGPLNLTVTPYGNVSVSGGDIIFDGVEDCVQAILPTSIRSGSWTIDFFYKPENIAVLRFLIGQANPDGSGDTNINVYTNPGGVLTASVRTIAQYAVHSSLALSLGVDHHIEISLDRQNNKLNCLQCFL
jgi:hypothetical protein